MQNATELCEAVGRPRMPAALLWGGAGIRKPSALAPLAASALALLPRVDSRVGDCAFERVALDVCDHGLAPRPGPTARRQGAGRRPAARAGTAQKFQTLKGSRRETWQWAMGKSEITMGGTGAAAAITIRSIAL